MAAKTKVYCCIANLGHQDQTWVLAKGFRCNADSIRIQIIRSYCVSKQVPASDVLVGGIAITAPNRESQIHTASTADFNRFVKHYLHSDSFTHTVGVAILRGTDNRNVRHRHRRIYTSIHLVTRLIAECMATKVEIRINAVCAPYR